MGKLFEEIKFFEEKVSKLMRKPTIEIIYKDFGTGKDVIYNNNKLYINSNNIKELSNALIESIIRESRTHYQELVITNKITNRINESTKMKWENEFPNRDIRQSDLNSLSALKKFALQAIEIDRIAYTEFFINAYLGLKMNYDLPSWLRVEVNKRKDEIKYECF
ncbi:MAG: hypothetical protein RBQ97_04875 [Acholeplasma sp.]|nr:hypothetical protein [Acholeplasma sp.]